MSTDIYDSPIISFSTFMLYLWKIVDNGKYFRVSPFVKKDVFDPPNVMNDF
jgi:hypothetical protein